MNKIKIEKIKEKELKELIENDISSIIRMDVKSAEHEINDQQAISEKSASSKSSLKFI